MSGGLIGKQSRKPVVVVAIPTFDAAGRLTGVLTGGIRLGSLGKSGQTEELGLSGLTVVDRNGQLILQQGLGHVSNTALLARMQAAKTGVVKGTAGLEGGSHHVVAFSTAALPAWTIAVDEPEVRRSMPAPGTRSSSISRRSASPCSSCSRSSRLAVRRSGRQIREQGQQAQSWTRLTRTLAAASTPAEVADAMLETVQEVFPDAVIVVSVHSETGDELRAASRLPGWRRVPGDDERFAAIAELDPRGPAELVARAPAIAPRPLPRVRPRPEGAPRRADPGPGRPACRRDRPAHRARPARVERMGAPRRVCRPGRAAARAGARASSTSTRSPSGSSRACSRRSFRPPRGSSLAGEYAAGGTGVDVGGDWYDAVLRPDGSIVLCVGDVSGRGAAAATVMGRQRSTFRAYAFDYVSPAEILRRMIRHVDDDEMTTVACISIDPLEGGARVLERRASPAAPARPGLGRGRAARSGERPAARGRGGRRRHRAEPAAPCAGRARDVHRRARRAAGREHRGGDRRSRADDGRASGHLARGR